MSSALSDALNDLLIKKYRPLVKTERRGGPLSRRQTKAVKQVIINNKEKNYFDVAPTGHEANTTGTLTLLTTIPQGDGEGERLRDMLTYKSYRVNIFAVGETSNGNTIYNSVRAILFKWKPDTAVDTPSVTDILETSHVMSPLVGNVDDRKKFSVLKDKLFTLDSRTGDQGPMSKLLLWTGKLSGKLRFNQAATTGSNHLYLLTLGNNPTGNDCAGVTVGSRVVYHD